MAWCSGRLTARLAAETASTNHFIYRWRPREKICRIESEPRNDLVGPEPFAVPLRYSGDSTVWCFHCGAIALRNSGNILRMDDPQPAIVVIIHVHGAEYLFPKRNNPLAERALAG